MDCALVRRYPAASARCQRVRSPVDLSSFNWITSAAGLPQATDPHAPEALPVSRGEQLNA